MDTFSIDNGTLSARLLPVGASLVDLRLVGYDWPLVLGFDVEREYAEADHYAGAIIGRHANRITGGHARIAGRDVQLPRNGGEHHLHGGATGLARQRWTVAKATPTSVQFVTSSPDGHEGYPGRLDVTVSYELVERATLRLSFEATVDAPTILNLCHHAYFNLSGRPDILDHQVAIAADRYTVASSDLVPTGEIRDVAGSDFDLRQPRTIGDARQSLPPGFNHNYCLASSARDTVALAARVTAPGAPALEVWTTQTGVHFYDGYKLRPELIGIEGRRYGPNAGLCLEAQNWPDAVNHPHFPSAEIGPGEVYRQVTEYRFIERGDEP
jgi:aldose 1-epimerase